jgi:O-antigen/teichoic acid export membrane protein
VTAVGLVIAFFMMPFIIGRVGDKWYGIWTIVGSVTGYYYLLDLGLGTAVTRYVTQYVTKGETSNANVTISTALVLYTGFAFLLSVITAVCAYGVQYVVDTPEDLVWIRLVLVIMGLNLALEFPFKAFSGVIGSYLRYDLLAYSHLATLVLGAVLTLICLGKGYGIVALALITFGCSQISNVLFYAIARRLFPEMKLGPGLFSKPTAWELFRYGGWAFVIEIGEQLRFKVDSLVIAQWSGAGQVTHFFVGARLAEYFLILLFKATNILSPLFTRYHALNNHEDMRHMLLFTTKVNTMLSVFGGGLIIVLGHPFLAIWMGDQYLDAYPVLVVLMIGMICEGIHTPANNVLYAVAKHRYLAYMTLLEGLVNLFLSLVLIRSYGLVGVALGTTIPLVVSRLVIIPRLTCRCIGLPLGTYYGSIGPVLAFTGCFVGIVYLMSENLLMIRGYAGMGVLALASAVVYGPCIAYLAFGKTERALLWDALPARIGLLLGSLEGRATLP